MRVPLGKDAWAMMKHEVATLNKELDEVRGVSEGAAESAGIKSVSS
jgi:hypothetical protein